MYRVFLFRVPTCDKTITQPSNNLWMNTAGKIMIVLNTIYKRKLIPVKMERP